MYVLDDLDDLDDQDDLDDMYVLDDLDDLYRDMSDVRYAVCTILSDATMDDNGYTLSPPRYAGQLTYPPPPLYPSRQRSATLG